MEIENIDRIDVEAYETFIHKNKHNLHPNHGFMIKAKKELTVAYGGYPGYKIETLTQERLLKKEAYCQQIIKLCQVLEPGISTQKGLTLYELWKARKEINKRTLSRK